MKTIKRHPIVVAFLNFLNPGTLCCQKCGLSLSCCKEKVVWHSKSEGVFAICDVCWNNSTLEEVKQYHTAFYRWQESKYSNSPYFTKPHYSIEHLLKCVEDEYNKTRVKQDVH